MKILFALAFISSLACTIGCEKEDCGKNEDFIVFGHFYGECVGEGCVEIYKLTDESLIEDVKDQYPSGNEIYEGDFSTILNDAKRDAVDDLESFFPEALLDETDTVIGQPDAGDWGGIYFEIKRGSAHRYWLLDQHEGNMPQAYNEFVDRINEKIIIINQ